MARRRRAKSDPIVFFVPDPGTQPTLRGIRIGVLFTPIDIAAKMASCTLRRGLIVLFGVAAHAEFHCDTVRAEPVRLLLVGPQACVYMSNVRAF